MMYAKEHLQLYWSRKQGKTKKNVATGMKKFESSSSSSTIKKWIDTIARHSQK